MVVQKKGASVTKVQLVAFGTAAIISFLFGLIQNALLGGDCYSFLDLGSCDANSFVPFFFRLYLVALFTMSFSHFAFLKWSKMYYLFLIFPLVLFGVSDHQFAPIVIAVLLGGSVSGVLFSKLKKKTKLRA